MTPPPQKECPVTGCGYLTPAALPTYDLLYRDLEMHTKYGHPAPAPQQAGDTSVGSSRADKLTRPALKDKGTEADFIFITDAWTRYKRSTGLTGQAAVDQLRACCSQEQISVSGSATEAVLLQAMEKMSVRAQNNPVNVVNFLGMGQPEGAGINMGFHH